MYQVKLLQRARMEDLEAAINDWLDDCGWNINIISVTVVPAGERTQWHTTILFQTKDEAFKIEQLKTALFRRGIDWEEYERNLGRPLDMRDVQDELTA